MKTLVRSPQGRRPQTVHGTIGGGNPVTGESVAWSDGSWQGTKRLVAEADYLCTSGEHLPIPGTGAFVVADSRSPVAVFAVIAALVGPHGVVEGNIPLDALARYHAISVLDPDDELGEDA